MIYDKNIFSDLATILPNGYGQIIGRIKDVVIRGGENLYPAEIENFLMSHPQIIEAQVIHFFTDTPWKKLRNRVFTFRKNPSLTY